MLVCSIGSDDFFRKDPGSLSPYFDLPSYIKSENERPENIFIQKESSKGKEVLSLQQYWNEKDDTYFVVNGNWIRSWADYIFVTNKDFVWWIGRWGVSRNNRQFKPNCESIDKIWVLVFLLTRRLKVYGHSWTWFVSRDWLLYRKQTSVGDSRSTIWVPVSSLSP